MGGTHQQFQQDGKLVTSPKILADMQNNDFIDKVEKLAHINFISKLKGQLVSFLLTKLRALTH